MESMTARHVTGISVLCTLMILVCGCRSSPIAFPAAPSGDELLNSERIELTFGSFGIEVVSEGPGLRVSNLYSIEGDARICRTFAVVAYPERIDPVLAETHARVRGGRPIGETFSAAGWSIRKVHRYFGEISGLHVRPRVAALMGLESPAVAAIHVYVLVVSRDGQTFDYATIAEVHHPDYLALEDLRALYGADVRRLGVQSEGIRPILANVRRELAAH